MMRFLARCAAALAMLVPVAAAGAAVDPPVTLVVHVVLAMPQATSPRPDSYCFGDTRPAALVPIPAAVLDKYERRLRALGTVRDHFGFGTWTPGAGRSSAVAFEAGDHIVVRTLLSSAKRALPGLLRAIRRDLHQQEALAEIFDGAYPDMGQPRTRLDVVLPYTVVSYALLRRLHLIFGDGGLGGATQYDDAAGVHVYSSVAPDAVSRVSRALRAAEFRFATAPSTFITDDAPACAAAKIR